MNDQEIIGRGESAKRRTIRLKVIPLPNTFPRLSSSNTLSTFSWTLESLIAPFLESTVSSLASFGGVSKGGFAGKGRGGIGTVMNSGIGEARRGGSIPAKKRLRR